MGVISPPSQVLDNMNPFWDGVLERHNNGDGSFSPCTASGAAVAAPTDICFPWQHYVAQPDQQTAGCLLHTHDLRHKQKTDALHRSPLGMLFQAFDQVTATNTHSFCRFKPPHKLVWHQVSESVRFFLPGHKKVSSLNVPTVSRDDSIVVALPSNILPGKEPNQGLSELNWLWFQNRSCEICRKDCFCIQLGDKPLFLLLLEILFNSV